MYLNLGLAADYHTKTIVKTFQQGLLELYVSLKLPEFNKAAT